MKTFWQVTVTQQTEDSPKLRFHFLSLQPVKKKKKKHWLCLHAQAGLAIGHVIQSAEHVITKHFSYTDI